MSLDFYDLSRIHFHKAVQLSQHDTVLQDAVIVSFAHGSLFASVNLTQFSQYHILHLV